MNYDFNGIKAQLENIPASVPLRTHNGLPVICVMTMGSSYGDSRHYAALRTPLANRLELYDIEEVDGTTVTLGFDLRIGCPRAYRYIIRKDTTLYDIFHWDNLMGIERDYDVGDNTYDVLNAICAPDWEETDDDFWKATTALMTRIRVVKHNAGSAHIVADVEGFLREYYLQIRKFGNEHSIIRFPEDPDAEYGPYDEDDHMYMGVWMVFNIFSGDYDDESYTDLVRIFQEVE